MGFWSRKSCLDFEADLDLDANLLSLPLQDRASVHIMPFLNTKTPILIKKIQTCVSNDGLPTGAI